ncbi:MAG: lipid-A-disaccharide synthase, partial [Planctomycetota bacterium]
ADQAETIFASGDVDGVVLVDFPGFNWHIARRARKHGIPVTYYCPPQLWAWGAWRAKKMKRLVDHVLAVLPIEDAFYQSRGIATTLVGHPFFDAISDQSLDHATLATIADAVGPRGRTIAVLPGSREHEVRANFPVFLETIRRLVAANSWGSDSVRFAVAAYRDSHCLWCREQLDANDENLPIDFYVNQTSEIIESAHCAMMVSGSVSLELMARLTPAAVLYRVGRLTHFVGKRVLQVDSITLPNLMGPRKVFPEMVCVGDPAPAVDFLHETVHAMLMDQFYFESLKRDLDQLRLQHAMPGASQAAANWLYHWLVGASADATGHLEGTDQSEETIVPKAA